VENDLRRQDFPKVACPRASIILGFLTQIFAECVLMIMGMLISDARRMDFDDL
jgi:hypothetical protein